MSSRSGTPAYADSAVFAAALLEAEVLIDSGVAGLPHRSGVFEDVLRAVEAYGAAQRVGEPLRRHFPPLMPRTDFERTGYLGSFPQLVGALSVFTGAEAEHRVLLAELEETDGETTGSGGDWSAGWEQAETTLCSSACHSLYGTLPTQIGEEGPTYELSGFCFRHEPSPDPMRMQSFRMLEFVRVGTPEQAVQHRDLWRGRGEAALAGLGLPVRVETASDPFFGRAGRLLAANQRHSELKLEIVVDVTGSGPTAIASANYHEDHFGHPFDIRTADGRVAHSACFGFGLERITLALFATHGLDPRAWPSEVLKALGR